MRGEIRRIATIVAVTMAAFFSSGCFKTRTVVRVNPDGSGELTVEYLVSRAMIKQMETQMGQMMDQMRAMGAEVPERQPMEQVLVSEKMLRHLAPMYGEVEFVSARALEQEGFVGSTAQYRFKDIRRIWIPLNDSQRGQMLGTMMSQGKEDELPPIEAQKDEKTSLSFDWTPEADGGKLTVRMPELPMVEIEDDPNWEPPSESDLTRQLATQGGEAAQMFGLQPGMTHEEVLKRLLGEMEVRIDVQVAGTVKSTTAKYAVKDRPNTFTLFCMDFSRILNSPKGLRLFSDERFTNGPTPPLAKGVPGMEIEQGEVSFEIAP